MRKNRGFLRKVRPCLYLVFGLGLFGCSVLKQENKPDTDLKTYRISGVLLPGFEESSLYAVLDGTTGLQIDQPPVTAGFATLPEQLTLIVRVNDEAGFQKVLERLQANGFRISNAALQN